MTQARPAAALGTAEPPHRGPRAGTTGPPHQGPRAGIVGPSATWGCRVYDPAMASRLIEPASIAPPAADYAHAVATAGASEWLHTSGVVPTRPDGSVPDGIAAQARTVWDNIAAMLGEARMAPHDIVSVVTYVVSGEDTAPVMAERDRFLGGHRAASTLVMVAALAQPAWKMEIAVVAAR